VTSIANDIQDSQDNLIKKGLDKIKHFDKIIDEKNAVTIY
jgi:aryl carrier-like protein